MLQPGFFFTSLQVKSDSSRHRVLFLAQAATRGLSKFLFSYLLEKKKSQLEALYVLDTSGHDVRPHRYWQRAHSNPNSFEKENRDGSATRRQTTGVFTGLLHHTICPRDDDFYSETIARFETSCGGFSI